MAQGSRPLPIHEYRPQFLFEISRNCANLNSYRYSRGDELGTLLQYCSGLLEAWEESVSLGKNAWDAETQFSRTSWKVNIELYSLCLHLAGLALLLDILDSQWQRLNAMMGMATML
ncbi:MULTISPECIES: PoNe immunity protein domain-containing protein [Xanthomonas]|uniref:PoNe immunity protein domain-containing protein n=1 Tax=Xanthomonas TaxID=338 RepID=UPI000E1F6AA4